MRRQCAKEVGDWKRKEKVEKRKEKRKKKIRGSVDEGHLRKQKHFTSIPCITQSQNANAHAIKTGEKSRNPSSQRFSNLIEKRIKSDPQP